MLTWLAVNWINIVVFAAVILVVGLVIRSMIRDKKAGKSSCGGSCGSCAGDCLRCVGACGLAPVATIGEKVYGRLNPSDIKKIVAEFDD